MERIRDELSAAGKSSVEISALDDMVSLGFFLVDPGEGTV